MKKNRLQLALDRLGKDPQLIDLVEGSFHEIGLIPPKDVFIAGFESWISQRHYRPDTFGNPKALNTLAEYYRSRSFQINETQILLTCSTSESYSLIFRTFARVGDRVLLPHPGYPLFEYLCDHHHLEMDFYQLKPEDDFQLSRSGLERAWQEGTKFLVLINPSNPTGQVLDKSSVDAALEFAKEKGLWLIVDEVFEPYIQENILYESPGKDSPPVLVFTLNGISKMFASPDLKLGWISITGPGDLVSYALGELEVSSDAYLSAGDFPQSLLPKLFSDLGEFQNQCRDLIRNNARTLAKWAAGFKNTLQVWLPQGGIHCPIRIHGRGMENWDDESWALKVLEEQKIYVHPGYFYDFPGKEPWLVISILQRPEKFEEALTRLGNFFKDRLV